MNNGYGKSKLGGKMRQGGDLVVEEGTCYCWNDAVSTKSKFWEKMRQGLDSVVEK
jgi:hypothetical protein